MPKVSALHQRPRSDEIDLAYILDGDIVSGVMDRISGTKIVFSGDEVTLVAGSHKKMTRIQAHTLFYSFMLISGWDEDHKRTR